MLYWKRQILKAPGLILSVLHISVSLSNCCPIMSISVPNLKSRALQFKECEKSLKNRFYRFGPKICLEIEKYIYQSYHFFKHFGLEPYFGTYYMSNLWDLFWKTDRWRTNKTRPGPFRICLENTLVIGSFPNFKD